MENLYTSQLLELIVETSAATWTVGADGYAVDIPEWTALTGQSVEELKGEGWMDAIHGEDLERVRSAWMTAIAHGSHYNTDYRVRCADGVYRWFNARGMPIVNVEGDIQQWIGVLLPIAGLNRFRQSATESSGTSAPFVDITPGALRAARAMLGWSASRLADMADVSISTIRRIEEADERDSTRSTTARKLIAALAQQPLTLIASAEGVIEGVSGRTRTG
jgi:PAS domain S-box-containing protein